MNSERADANADPPHPEYVKFLGMRIDSYAGGKAQMTMAYSDVLLNGHGVIHGGAIASLCDSAFWVALASHYGREQITATATMTCNFLRPALPGHDLIAHAAIIRAGRRIVYGDVDVFSNDKLVAHATLSYVNSPSPGE